MSHEESREPNEADKADVANRLSVAHELETSEKQSLIPNGFRDEPVTGIALLASIMQATFFTDLFCYHADARFGHPTRQERVSALQGAHPKFYLWCRNADFIARAILMLAVTGVASTAAVGVAIRLFY